MWFTDRADAGRRLARRLDYLRGSDVVVLGLPRGGVPVAFEVAMALGAPLDVIVVRKLGVPFQPELAMGAIGEGGIRVLNDDLVRRARLAPQEIAAVEEHERQDLERQARTFRAGRTKVDVAGRTAVVVDDGIATGSTAAAACQAARRQGAARVILAVPVAAPEAVEALRGVCDAVICLYAPELFLAVGQWYDDFRHVPDAGVASLLERAAGELAVAAVGRPASGHEMPARAGGKPPLAGPASDPPVRDEHVEVEAGPVTLAGHLTVPERAIGFVVFVHGSGSSRHSPRNRYVARQLNEAELGTLLFDLLTPAEELDRANVFDIGMLASRLAEVTRWLRDQPEARRTRLGYFGASTGAAAALWAAADPGADIAAVVSRGGRPDLAGTRLATVRAPTLLIVGGRDDVVLDLNRRAQQRLRCENRLEIVPGATHLFEEPGALPAITSLASDWFTSHLSGQGGDRAWRASDGSV